MWQVVLLSWWLCGTLASGCQHECQYFTDDAGLTVANCTINGLLYGQSSFPVQTVNLKKPFHGVQTKLQSQIFHNFAEALYLNLQNASIFQLPDDVFNSLPNVVYIDLSFNKIRNLNGIVFKPLTSLRNLNLRGNILGVSRREVIVSNTLHELDMGFCGIVTIPTYTFSCTPNLQHLFLDGNYIKTLENNALPHMLSYLNLSNNNIVDVPIYIFDSLLHLNRLDLSGNPVNCSCYLVVFQDTLSGWAGVFENDIICHNPPHLQGTKISKVIESQFCNDDISSEWRRNSLTQIGAHRNRKRSSHRYQPNEPRMNDNLKSSLDFDYNGGYHDESALMDEGVSTIAYYNNETGHSSYFDITDEKNLSESTQSANSEDLVEGSGNYEYAASAKSEPTSKVDFLEDHETGTEPPIKKVTDDLDYYHSTDMYEASDKQGATEDYTILTQLKEATTTAEGLAISQTPTTVTSSQQSPTFLPAGNVTDSPSIDFDQGFTFTGSDNTTGAETRASAELLTVSFSDSLELSSSRSSPILQDIYSSSNPNAEFTTEFQSEASTDSRTTMAFFDNSTYSPSKVSSTAEDISSSITPDPESTESGTEGSLESLTIMIYTYASESSSNGPSSTTEYPSRTTTGYSSTSDEPSLWHVGISSSEGIMMPDRASSSTPRNNVGRRFDFSTKPLTVREDNLTKLVTGISENMVIDHSQVGFEKGIASSKFTYIIIALLVGLVLIFLVVVACKKRRKSNNIRLAVDLEASRATELRDMLLPKSPESAYQLVPKVYKNGTSLTNGKTKDPEIDKAEITPILACEPDADGPCEAILAPVETVTARLAMLARPQTPILIQKCLN